MKKNINLIIAVLCFFIVVLLCRKMSTAVYRIWVFLAAGLGIIHLFFHQTRRRRERLTDLDDFDRPADDKDGALTELVLLNENDHPLATWNIYGKNGVVIGRDVGENQVTVNLNHTTYASMIDVEHAVLNFIGDDWCIEDISERNGVSIQKKDGKKYKLSYGKPCRLERGDIIYIALTRLQIR